MLMLTVFVSNDGNISNEKKKFEKQNIKLQKTKKKFFHINKVNWLKLHIIKDLFFYFNILNN